MCYSVKLLALNDLSESYVIFNLYTLYSFLNVGITILIPGHTASLCNFLNPGQWTVTHSMIVSGIVL